MLEPIYSSSIPGSVTYYCQRLAPPEGEAPYGVDDRQARIEGWEQDAVEKIRAIILGVGLAGYAAYILTRKGVEALEMLDGDSVTLTNLNRQFFTDEDLDQNKAVAVARNLQRHGYLGTRLTGHPYFAEDFPGSYAELEANVIVCAVDNDPGRMFAARLGRELGIPVIFTAAATDASEGYVFVQTPDGPCFGCLNPHAIGNESTPCPGQGAIVDIQMLLASFVAYAIDSLFMPRLRGWNYRLVRLPGFAPDLALTIERRPNCPLCGAKEASDAA